LLIVEALDFELSINQEKRDFLSQKVLPKIERISKLMYHLLGLERESDKLRIEV
jgi:hypothetical protein